MISTLTEQLDVSSDERTQLRFLLRAHNLTSVERLNRLLDGSRAENSAEHSWHLAITTLVLADRYAPQVDISRVMMMLIIHDLPEVEVGDVPIYDESARAAVSDQEDAAAEMLFLQLPGDQGKNLLGLWREFETASSPEARFAKAIDRLQPLLLHWAGDGAAWKSRDVSIDQERRLMMSIYEYWPELAALTEELISNAYSRGMLRSPAV